MKYQNHHVSPTEIESILLQHPDILEAAVVPVPHKIDIERAMAFVRKLPTSQVEYQEIKKYFQVLIIIIFNKNIIKAY